MDFGAKYIRYTKRIGVTLERFKEMTELKLKWCAYHKKFEHISCFGKARHLIFGLNASCRDGLYEKYHNTHTAPIVKRKLFTLEDQKDFLELIEQIGRIKRAAIQCGATIQNLYRAKKSDPLFSQKIAEAQGRYFKNKYGNEYEKKESINLEHLNFFLQNENQIRTWIENTAIAKSQGQYIDIDEIQQMTTISWIYSANRKVKNKKRLIQYYARCAFYTYKRNRHEIVKT